MQYQADVSAALKELRERVFENVRYAPDVTVSFVDYEKALNALGSSRQADIEYFLIQAADPKTPQKIRDKFTALTAQIKENLNQTKSLQKSVDTIEELLERRGEKGTHTILDIIRVSSDSEFGAINPLEDLTILEIFGTNRPSQVQIIEKYEEGKLERYINNAWQGIYIIVYRCDSPAEIFFAGCSGD